MDTSTRTICFRANTTTGLSGLPCATKYTCNTPLHIHDENCNAHHIILHCANEMLYAIEDLHGEFTYMLHLCCSQLWHDIARACCGDEMTCNMGDRMMSDVFPVPIARYTALPCMCIGQAFTYPCVHSFTHLSMCSFKHSLIHACDYLFMYLFIHLSMCSFIHSLIHVFIQAFTYPCIRLSFHVFIHSLIHVLIHLFGQALWCCCVGLCRAKARSVGSSLQETTPSLQKCATLPRR